MTSHRSIDNFFAICRYGDTAFLYKMQMMKNGLIDFYQTKGGTEERNNDRRTNRRSFLRPSVSALLFYSNWLEFNAFGGYKTS